MSDTTILFTRTRSLGQVLASHWPCCTSGLTEERLHHVTFETRHVETC